MKCHYVSKLPSSMLWQYQKISKNIVQYVNESLRTLKSFTLFAWNVKKCLFFLIQPSKTGVSMGALYSRSYNDLSTLYWAVVVRYTTWFNALIPICNGDKECFLIQWTKFLNFTLINISFRQFKLKALWIGYKNMNQKWALRNTTNALLNSTKDRKFLD